MTCSDDNHPNRTKPNEPNKTPGDARKHRSFGKQMFRTSSEQKPNLVRRSFGSPFRGNHANRPTEPETGRGPGRQEKKISIKSIDRGTAEGAGKTLTSHATPGYRSGFATGMFANDPERSENMSDFFFDVERVCYHEAGHAVLGYALGDGLTQIELSEVVALTDSGKLISVGGLCASRRYVDLKIYSRIRRRILDDRVVGSAVEIAAGPAAERKFNILNNQRQRLLGGSAGDHTGTSWIHLDPYFDIPGEARHRRSRRWRSISFGMGGSNSRRRAFRALVAGE